jgi:CubicO group peptidase (beta-lactamase class C family)
MGSNHLKGKRVRSRLPPLLLCLSLSSSFLLPSSCIAQQTDALPHPKTLEELQKAVKGVLDKEHVPGAGVALVSGGTLLWCGGIGKADIAANRDVTCDTEFRVGSISKSFVALALLKLQEDGRINLEARLQDVAPEIPVENPWEVITPVRIVNLLEHTAGFDDMQFSEVYNLRDPYDYPLLDVFKRFRKPEEVRWPPGTRMSYSNPGYGVAGYLIEKTAGKPFDQYIRETILRPLGMEIADFPFTDANKSLLATAYGGNPPKALGYPLIYLRPAGDLKASPGELAKLIEFFLRRGKFGDMQILKPESIMRMEFVETTLAAKNGLQLGYGLANYSQVQGGVVTRGHNGGIEGFLSTYRYMPEQNWGYVILLNSADSGRALRELNELAIDFLEKNLPRLQQPVTSLPASELEKFTGYYASRAPRNQVLAFVDDFTQGVRIRVIHGQLTRSGLSGAPVPLFLMGKNIFRLENEPEASTIFFPDGAGNMALTSNGLEPISYAQRSSLAWLYLRIALLALCLALMATSPLFAVIWSLRKLFGGMKDVRHLSVRTVPVLAILFLAVIPLCATRLTGQTIGALNLWTLGIFLGSVLFPLLSLVGLFLAVSVPRNEIHPGVRIHSYLVSLACCMVTIFFSSWHLIALCTWSR